MTMSQRPKPDYCPFCGGDTKCFKSKGNGTWEVMCNECGAETPPFDTRERAISWWNRRVRSEG